ncbi:MAG: hypothetical protein ACLPXT_12005 [Terracidiphilus sp.]
MTIPNRATLISAVLLSICLIALVPGSLQFASTWMTPYLRVGNVKVENFMMLEGCYSLAIEIIGLVVLWTGYRAKERWAWVILFTILTLFVFPSTVLHTLLKIHEGTYQWSFLLTSFSGIRVGQCENLAEHYNSRVALGILDFLVMTIAILLPIKAFFWKSRTPRVSDEHNRQNGGVPVGDK